MSVLSLAVAKGSRVSVLRPVYVTGSGQSQIPTSFTTVATAVPIVLQVETAERALRLYGLDIGEAVLTGFEASGTDIRKNDRLSVTAGFQNGSRFQVREVRPFAMGTRSHVELGLTAVSDS